MPFRTVFLLAVVGWFLGPSTSAAQTIVLQRRIQTTGTIESVAAGTIVIKDAQGQKISCKIQEKGEPGVSLGGATAVIDFPATVTVSGNLSAKSLAKGTLVRFVAQLNRLGRTSGKVGQITIFDEGAYKLGVEELEPAAERGGAAKCQITADIYSADDGRMVVTVPNNNYVRKPRLAFSLADGVKVKLRK